MSEANEPVVPYRHMLQGRDPAEVMRTTLPRFELLLANFSAGEIDTPPAPGKWSLREQTCHLADCEIAWAWRLRQTFSEDNPPLQSFEQDPWARAYAGPRYTFATALQSWRTMRNWNLAFLETLSAEEKARPAQHSSAGPISLWTLVEIAAGHDLHHLLHLKSLADARQPTR